MAQHAHLDDKLAFTSPNFNPVLALKSKELAERCSKARPFDNLRQYVASLQQSESFKSLGWFPKEFGHARVTGKRPSKRKASSLYKPDLAYSDTSSSDIDVVKSQRRKQVKLSSSQKDPQKSVPSSDEAFKSLFLPSSDEALLFTDKDLYKKRGAAPKNGNNFGSTDEETSNRNSKLSYQRELSQRDKYFEAEDLTEGQRKQEYKKKEILEGDFGKVETSLRNKNENEFQIQSRLKSLANVRSVDLKKANKAERVKRFQNVMIEKLEEQKKRSTRIRGNVLQRMEAFQNGPLSVLYNCMNKGIKLKVWTRRYKGLRGVCTGYLIAFDKHMNLAMIDVDEVYTLEIRTLSEAEQKEIAKQKRTDKKSRNRLNRIKKNCEFIAEKENIEKAATDGWRAESNIFAPHCLVPHEATDEIANLTEDSKSRLLNSEVPKTLLLINKEDTDKKKGSTMSLSSSYSSTIQQHAITTGDTSMEVAQQTAVNSPKILQSKDANEISDINAQHSKASSKVLSDDVYVGDWALGPDPGSEVPSVGKSVTRSASVEFPLATLSEGKTLETTHRISAIRHSSLISSMTTDRSKTDSDTTYAINYTGNSKLTVTGEASDDTQKIINESATKFPDKVRPQLKADQVVNVASNDLDFDISESSDEEDDVIKSRISDSDDEDKDDDTSGVLSGVLPLEKTVKVGKQNQNLVKDSMKLASASSDLGSHKKHGSFFQKESKPQLRCTFSLFSGLAKQRKDRMSFKPKLEIIQEERPESQTRCKFSLFSRLAKHNMQFNSPIEEAPRRKSSSTPEDFSLASRRNLNTVHDLKPSSSVAAREEDSHCKHISPRVLEDKVSFEKTRGVSSNPETSTSCSAELKVDANTDNVRNTSTDLNIDRHSEEFSSDRRKASNPISSSELVEESEDPRSIGILGSLLEERLKDSPQQETVEKSYCKEIVISSDPKISSSHIFERINDFENGSLIRLELQPRVAYSEMRRSNYSSNVAHEGVLDVSRDPRVAKMKDDTVEQIAKPESCIANSQLKANDSAIPTLRCSEIQNEYSQAVKLGKMPKHGEMVVTTVCEANAQKLYDISSPTDKHASRNIIGAVVAKSDVKINSSKGKDPRLRNRRATGDSSPFNLTPERRDFDAFATKTCSIIHSSISSGSGVTEIQSDSSKSKDPRLGRRRTKSESRDGVRLEVSNDDRSILHTVSSENEIDSISKIDAHCLQLSTEGMRNVDYTADVLVSNTSSHTMSRLPASNEVNSTQSCCAESPTVLQIDSNKDIPIQKIDKDETFSNKKKCNRSFDAIEDKSYTNVIEKPNDKQALSIINDQAENITISKDDSKNLSKNLPAVRRTTENALSRFFQKQKATKTEKPIIQDKTSLPKKQADLERNLAQLRRTIFDKRASVSGRGRASLPTVSAVFDPRRPVPGHVFRERHVNQIFIRGDNVAMVAYDKI